MIYYKDEEYVETEHVGLATSSFETEKFRDVAFMLEKLMTDVDEKVPDLITYKLKNGLRPYANMVTVLNDFAERKVVIGQIIYELQVFLLRKVNCTDYSTTVKCQICAI